MAKQQLTLTIQSDLIEKMKLHAVLAKRSLSYITEELYREYLKRKGATKIKI